jgi:[glutamine synthetase] adenylyltransferase / [glutamine synthetase]-adenylyl-L-tyrosine phosphorylase
MEIASLIGLLDRPSAADESLSDWGVRDRQRARQVLLDLADTGLTLDLLAALCKYLAQQLPREPDPDLVLHTFRQFLFASRSPLALGSLFERDPSAIALLLRAFSLGPRWRELLLAYPEAFDYLRQTEGQPRTRQQLLDEILAELSSFTDERAIAAALWRIRQRELLRIAYGDLILRHKVELVTEQLTLLAECILEGALSAAERRTRQTTGAKVPLTWPRICLLGRGRLGGGELDYQIDLPILAIYDAQGVGESVHRGAHEYAERVIKFLQRLLTVDDESDTPLYRLHFAGLPESQSPATIHSVDDALLGLDSFGRTWHRQEMLKARSVAGDRQLGQTALEALQSWIFRRYLYRADETGIKALRRRILRRGVAADPHGSCDVMNGRGGLFDLESVVQFLQLLVGGDQPKVRRPATLDAIAGLEQAGVLTVPERTLLEESYRWLRQVQHRVQILTSPTQSTLPTDELTLAQLAISLGEPAGGDPFVAQVRRRLEYVWDGLSRLLEASFAEEPPPPVVDLLLDPDSASDTAQVLSAYGFAQPAAAAANLAALAQERVPFLSTRRCRHFLTLIVERLLQAIGSTPDPDATLDNLLRVSDSLGGKGVLWELFRLHPPSLLLYVRLCAASPYLSEVLTTHPGMIDDLVDSLQHDRLPMRSELERHFAELSRGAGDPSRVLYDLKHASHLRIGVRDILGQDSIDATHRALSDVAEFCLAQVAERELTRLVEKHGTPTVGPGPFEGQTCQVAILGLGKLGGREPNYHSNLEIAVLYESEGTTQPAPRTRQQRTTNSHFFTQLVQRILKELTQLTPQGRLYAVDVALRPIGVGGAMALPLADFANHFLAGAAPMWQWQALCKARPVFGETPFRQAIENVRQELLTTRPWNETDSADIFRQRLETQRGASELNLKRGRGGTLDIECLVQALQLRHAAASPRVLVPSTQDALQELAAAGHLDRDDAEYLAESYRLLRRIESGLRLLNTPARHDLPADPLELAKLALLLGQPSADTLRDRSIMTLAENRRRMERILGIDSPPAE